MSFLTNSSPNTAECWTHRSDDEAYIPISWTPQEDHVLTQDILEDFTKCYHLELPNQNITDIQDGALASMSDTSYLSINNNSLTALRKAMFQGGISYSLYWLEISHNSISYIENNCFSDLHELGRLYLHHNPLGAGINPETFSGLNNYFTLHLSYTNVEVVPGLFQNMLKLRKLIVNGNPFRYLSNMWEGLKLKELELQDANITDPHPELWQGSLSRSLETLYLNKNHIPTLKAHSFQGLNELRVLGLSECGMQHIQARAFEGPPHLVLISLRGNPFLSIDHNMLGNIQNWPSWRSVELMFSAEFFPCIESLCWLKQTTERGSKIESPYFDLFVTRCENMDKTVLEFFENDCP